MFEDDIFPEDDEALEPEVSLSKEAQAGIASKMIFCDICSYLCLSVVIIYDVFAMLLLKHL